jgi:hypothetical protein
MAATFGSMVDEVLINLAGYTLNQDRTTYLTAAFTSTTSPSTSPLVLSLASTDNLGKGIIEINDELMWVESFDRVVNTATIAPYGRGYLGTTASTASVDTKVTISPTFPRYSVKRAINDTIRAMGSSIFAVKQATFTYNPAVTTYSFENLGIESILRMMWQDIGPSKEWITVRRWDFDPQAQASAWDSTGDVQTVSVYDYITPGRTVKIMYATEPTSLTNTNDNFSSVSGLPESCKDVVILGASYRLLTYIDPARVSQTSPQADELDAKRPFGASNNVARQLLALYTQRLSEENARQQSLYPPRIHYTR